MNKSELGPCTTHSWQGMVTTYKTPTEILMQELLEKRFGKIVGHGILFHKDLQFYYAENEQRNEVYLVRTKYGQEPSFPSPNELQIIYEASNVDVLVQFVPNCTTSTVHAFVVLLKTNPKVLIPESSAHQLLQLPKEHKVSLKAA